MDTDGRHNAFLRATYFRSLDGLRAISIIAVIWCHSRPRATGILAEGAMGVELFFAISGLLTTTLLLREQSRTGTISLWGF
jgi:peptidoglycan/LPS O-acetylase OafA/YrhL